MADEEAQPAQAYDSTLKEWILQQPQEIIAVLLPGNSKCRSYQTDDTCG